MDTGSPGQEEDDPVMDQFMEKFRTQKYEGAFNPETWEQEIEKIPMFMKKSPSDIDPDKAPELACLQSILFDTDRPPEEQAKSYKDEGNEYFKEKNYKQAVESYTQGIKKNCSDVELNAILYTNRAAAQFHIGNYRSAINDAISARKLKPDHSKAIIRGALCFMEIKNYNEALKWCDEGLKIYPSDKKLLETRTNADKLLRTAERNMRKSKHNEKNKQKAKESLLAAIRSRGIQLQTLSLNEEDAEDASDSHELLYDGTSTDNATGAHVFLDESGRLSWPVLFFYPEHGQTDFISAFHEDSRFIDHLHEMFADSPPWDTDRKYCAENLEIYFENEQTQALYQVNKASSLLQVLQHKRLLVKGGTPSFLIFVKKSPFCTKYLSGRTVRA
ncbi:tetratricopeptide repeat protein 4 [Bombina bombina]|uniref:tetratricopeptide repeat protein 4 n=1 Tax=Bombina bombina TaxID=8345 RepID=UPI00235AF6AA|nr:tetratricopeptide repeat protein 4 [Bombina bombina]